jgi:hypothetical protein
MHKLSFARFSVAPKPVAPKLEVIQEVTLPVVEEKAPEEPVVEEKAPEEPVVEEKAPEEPVVEEKAPEEPVVEESPSESPKKPVRRAIRRAKKEEAPTVSEQPQE